MGAKSRLGAYWNKYGTSIQGTPPFRGHKIWSRKNVQIIFVFVMALLKGHLYSGRDALFLSTENTDSTSIQPGNTSAPKKRLTQKIVTTSISSS